MIFTSFHLLQLDTRIQVTHEHSLSNAFEHKKGAKFYLLDLYAMNFSVDKTLSGRFFFKLYMALKLNLKLHGFYI